MWFQHHAKYQYRADNGQCNVQYLELWSAVEPRVRGRNANGGNVEDNAQLIQVEETPRYPFRVRIHTMVASLHVMSGTEAFRLNR